MIRVDPDFLDRFHALDANTAKGFAGTPPSRKLALLVRPLFIAETGKTFVWCDWSAIEARVLPWLAASRGADKVLQVFRENDADPSLPDGYCIEAAGTRRAHGLSALDIKHMVDAKDPEGVALRQVGKVLTLSLGFGGAHGALAKMATNYGVYFDEAESKELVGGWRERNSWAPMFWGRHNSRESYGLWGTALTAIDNPDTPYEVGRVIMVYDRTYLGGTLFIMLPDGRPLVYPHIKWRRVEKVDPETGRLIEKDALVFKKQHGWKVLWHGVFAENITQAVAGSILRKTLVKLEEEICDADGFCDEPYADFMPVVGHTHDEIVTEVDESIASHVRAILHDIMVEGFEWSAGLPLAAEASSNWYYTKAKV